MIKLTSRYNLSNRHRPPLASDDAVAADPADNPPSIFISDPVMLRSQASAPKSA